MDKLDKFRGCLLGGAAGDALGYPIEFSDAQTIFATYGAQGIQAYALKDGVAKISDDTQMTLFTANGLLIGTTRAKMRGIFGGYPGYLWRCYQDWLRTQSADTVAQDAKPVSWLYHVPELHHARAPGHTCINALLHGKPGTLETPINQSKGCGGIMRVAPIGLYFQSEQHTPAFVARLGAQAAALTHGHELGYLPAAALVHILYTLVHTPQATLPAAVQAAMHALPRLFPQSKHLNVLLLRMERAIALSAQECEDCQAIRALGQGWVAEETLAIALYCALKYEHDFDRALIAAVNHDGDSDSTGAVTGNLLGACLGLAAIPQKYLDSLELKDVILEIADDLFYDCQMSEYSTYHDEIWASKYSKATIPPSALRKQDPS